MSTSIAGAAAYGSFALLQEVPLAQLQPYTTNSRLESAQRVAPAWFAAAAEDQSDLLATAPELLASWDNGEVAPDFDLVAMYAPEYREQFDAPKQAQPVVEPTPPPPPPAHDAPRTSVQMQLMRELNDLE